MAEPFRAAAPSGGLDRVLRSKRAAAIEAIEDLLARSEDVRAVTAAAVRVVCDGCSVDLQRKYLSDRKHLYRRYLVYCLEDKVLSEEENADLKHLLGILHLSDEDVTPVHEDVAQEVYGKAIEEVLEDFKLDPDEEAFLRRLRGDLRISEEVAQRLYTRGEQRARERMLSEASAGDTDFLRYRAPAGNFTGRSDTTIEDAVSDALSKATLVIPDLHWFEVTQIAGYVGDGKAQNWHVTVRAGLQGGD